ncbi:MAG: hypothetical protein ACREO4_06130 [Lysobacter sp.]
MSYKASNELAELMLGAVKTALDGGTLTIFSGSVPADAGEALDLVADHTILAVLTVDNDGTTGLTFDAAVEAVVAKAAAESWEGTIAFSGTEETEDSLAPTFWRFCASGDAGTGLGSGPRIQGTAGGPASSADVKLGADTFTDNGVNTAGLSVFNVRLSALA